MMAQKLRFSCGLKAKVPGAVTARVPAPTLLVEIFTGSAPIDWTQEATMVKVRIFFFFFTFEGLSNVWLLFYQRFDAALLLWSSLDSWLAMFHSRRCSYIRTDDPSTKTGVHCELEHRGLRSQQFCDRCGYFFFTRRPRQQFPLPANLHRHSRHTHFQQDEISSLLDRRRHESHQTYRSYQLVLHLGTSTTLFPAIWTRTAQSIEELFSQWTRPTRASSDQRTDEEDTSETCNNNHVGGRTMTKAKKRNWGRTYIYVLGHRDGRFGDVYIRPVAVNGLT